MEEEMVFALEPEQAVGIVGPAGFGAEVELGPVGFVIRTSVVGAADAQP